jgi:anti-sigma regulatory factor (Ser/Thr protein kinase)
VELHAALSADPGQVAVARRLLRGYLADRASDRSAQRHDVPVLLLSELVTNAIRHAQPPLALRAATIGPGLRVEVHDGAPDPPVLSAQRPLDDEQTESGRGLFLVASLADRWGWDGNPTGKAVWFELDAF